MFQEAKLALEEGADQIADLDSMIEQLEKEGELVGSELRQLSHSERTGRVSPGEAARYRVTIWARQGIKHWFNPNKEPVGFIKDSILVVYGVHCRLENICSKKGTWLEEEKFYVGGQLVHRLPGEAVPANIMQGWRKLRKEHPQLFQKKVLVWQQPAAVVDGVLYYWYQKLEASETKQMVRLVDMLRPWLSD
jgi:hypothetical protein